MGGKVARRGFDSPLEVVMGDRAHPLYKGHRISFRGGIILRAGNGFEVLRQQRVEIAVDQGCILRKR